MPAAAWGTVIIAALIIAMTAVGLLRVILHLMAIRKTLAATTGGVRRHRGPDQPGTGTADLGQRQPQASPGLL